MKSAGSESGSNPDDVLDLVLRDIEVLSDVGCAVGRQLELHGPTVTAVVAALEVAPNDLGEMLLTVRTTVNRASSSLPLAQSKINSAPSV